MDIKIWRIIFSLLLFLAQGTILAAEIILTERKKEWAHPVLSVFKKYGISLIS